MDTFLKGSREEREQIIGSIKDNLGEAFIIPFQKVAEGFMNNDELLFEEKFE